MTVQARTTNKGDTVILAMSIILGIMGAVGYFFAVGESNTPADRKKKAVGLWLNLVAQIPWVIFNLATGAWGLFPINIMTVISSVRGLRLLKKAPADDNE